MPRENKSFPEPPDLNGLGARFASRSTSPSAILQAVGLAGPSPASAALAAAVAGAASQPHGVLVVGEAGAGHALVARALHLLTRPPTAPFLILSCATDTGRFARQLFGDDDHHAFRQAPVDGRTPAPERLTESSLLWRAQGGTLFIDGIDELPDTLQARLAHLLRDREAVIVEQDRRVPIDLHLVGGARGGVEREVEAGRMRPDLFHRLAARIALVPLRERPQDIAAVAAHWLESACRRNGVPPKKLEQAAEVLLAALPWRGNVSELRSALEVFVARVPGDTIRIDAVLAAIPGGETTLVTPTAMQRQLTLRDARREFEREYIAAVLSAHHGRIPDAAKALGIQRTNLYRKLRSLKLTAGGTHVRRGPHRESHPSVLAAGTLPRTT